MILTTEVSVVIIGKTLKYFRNLEYKVNVGDVIKIPIDHLNKKSRIKIDVKCDVCGKEKLLAYQKYTKSIESHNYYSCSQKCSVNKCKKTFLINFGVSSPMKIDDIKSKGKQTKKIKYGDENFNNRGKSDQTKLERYGNKKFNNIDKIKETIKENYNVENIMFLEDFKEKVKLTKINNGKMLPDELLSEFKKYKSNAMRVTRRNKSTIFREWDGFDYYDKEYIKSNLSLNSNDRFYPTIDHKISIAHGFLNSISYDLIGSLSKLCVTKKYLNSKKGFSKSHELFESLLKSC